ncbi:MerR family DNA-binding transcriptional regulator [Actinomadura sp. KC06]|nr:MerR family DNA-binding transcriptional regulator [Actinomadura sp. KC06]
MGSLDASRPFVPQRSTGGHPAAAPATSCAPDAAGRDLVDQGTAPEAACRTVLEDQLTEAQRINAQLQQLIDADAGRDIGDQRSSILG